MAKEILTGSKASTTVKTINGRAVLDGASIHGLSASGKTITYTKGDSSTGTITTQDTTYTFATGDSNGQIKVTPSSGSATNVSVKGLGSAAYTASTAYAAASHNQASNTINAMTGYSKASSASAIAATDSLNTAIGKLEKALDNVPTDGPYLPLSGGTLEGNIYTHAYDEGVGASSCKMIICKSDTVKGTLPANTQWHTLIMAKDGSDSINNNAKYGQVETAVTASGSVFTTLQAYKNEAGSTEGATIAVGYDANGNAYTQAPTPATADNSTKIATTAFVKSQGYLTSHQDISGKANLSGATFTGDITLANSASNQRYLLTGAFTRNVVPASNVYWWNLLARDKAGNATSGLYYNYGTNKSSFYSLMCYKGTSADSTYAYIGVGYDASGNAYTYAPTPATTNNSTQIATTAFVKSQGYLTGITKAQVTTALGYTPPTSDTNTTYSAAANGGLTLSGTAFSADGSKIINNLSTGTANPTDADYYVTQYAGGGTTTTSYHRRPHSALYNYMKGKMDSVYAAKSHTHSEYVSTKLKKW